MMPRESMSTLGLGADHRLSVSPADGMPYIACTQASGGSPTVPMPLNQPTADAITRFLTAEKRRHAQTTVTNRRPLLYRVARAHNGDLLGLTGDDIDMWLDRLPIAPNTRRFYLSTLASFYAWCVRSGILERNAARDAMTVRVPRGLPRPARDDDLAVALAAADPRMRVWLSLMAFGGFRCCEVAGLHVEDIHWHLDPPVIHVCHGSKGGNERVVPVAETTEAALLEIVLPRSGPVFRNDRTFRPITAAHVSRTTSRFLGELELRARPHQLRHWFATAVYQQSLDIRATQTLLGHSSPQTTAIYTAFNSSSVGRLVRTLCLP